MLHRPQGAWAGNADSTTIRDLLLPYVRSQSLDSTFQNLVATFSAHRTTMCYLSNRMMHYCHQRSRDI
jgi:hypothetical protein